MPQGSTVTISGPQRQAFRLMLLQNLSGIADLWLAFTDGRVATASQLGRQFGQDLRLMDDLGWGVEADDVDLTMAPAELAEVLQRMRADAEGGLREGTHERQVRAADEETRARYRFVMDTCQGLLLVIAHLREHKADWPLTPGAIGRGLGGRSAGAVANCLDRLVTQRQARLVTPKPRAYKLRPKVKS
jgi:hypothetical protein